jgi:hypothetical protein
MARHPPRRISEKNLERVPAHPYDGENPDHFVTFARMGFSKPLMGDVAGKILSSVKTESCQVNATGGGRRSDPQYFLKTQAFGKKG